MMNFFNLKMTVERSKRRFLTLSLRVKSVSKICCFNLKLLKISLTLNKFFSSLTFGNLVSLGCKLVSFVTKIEVLVIICTKHL